MTRRIWHQGLQFCLDSILHSDKAIIKVSTQFMEEQIFAATQHREAVRDVARDEDDGGVGDDIEAGIAR